MDHTGCIIVQLECRDEPRRAVKRGVECHGAVERQRERVETSQAHRQTLNPIAWAGSRKRIVRDTGGGGGEGKSLFPPFFPFSFCIAHSRSPNAVAVAKLYCTSLHNTAPARLSPLTDCQCDGGAALRRGIGGKPRGHKSIKTTQSTFYDSAHFIKSHYHTEGCSLK